MTNAIPDLEPLVFLEPVSPALAARFAAACNQDRGLQREKLEFCIAAYCDADAAIREAYRQEGVTKCE